MDEANLITPVFFFHECFHGDITGLIPCRVLSPALALTGMPAASSSVVDPFSAPAYPVTHAQPLRGGELLLLLSNLAYPG